MATARVAVHGLPQPLDGAWVVAEQVALVPASLAEAVRGPRAAHPLYHAACQP